MPRLPPTPLKGALIHAGGCLSHLQGERGIMGQAILKVLLKKRARS
jgi:hypothetical protein